MKRSTLHARFLRAISWTAGMLGVLMSVVIYRSAETHLRDSGTAAVGAMISAIEKTAAVGAYAGDSQLLGELTTGLSRHPYVARVDAVNARGELLLRVTAQASTMAAAQIPATFDQALYSPFDNQEVVGRMRVWINDEKLSSEAGREALMLVLALLVLLSCLLIVFNALALRLLSRPMRQLAEQLTGMQPGTASRIQLDAEHQHDEVGTVSNAANRLLELQQEALERERSMRADIAAMEARYRGIFDSTSAGIFILSPTGQLINGNPALGRLLGFEDGIITPELQLNFLDQCFPQSHHVIAMMDNARDTHQAVAADIELRSVHGDTVWAHCLLSWRTDSNSGDARIEGVLYDISQRKKAESLAVHRAEHDALTGLKSRAYIEATLDQKVQLSHDRSSAITLMFIDLDGFKSVNDNWGHAAGDAVLIEAAQRLRTLFRRSSDIVGRIGGDELVVLLDGLHASDEPVRLQAELLLQSFQRPFTLPNGYQVRVGASVGVASYPQHATTSATLIKAADAAMYAVKQAGKGGFSIATDTAPHSSSDRTEASSAAPEAASMHDPLTGLPDRRLLTERLMTALKRTQRSGLCAAVVGIDIDNFKDINLARGASEGDELLCEVARRINALMRTGDTVARTGSDEFVIVVGTDGRSREQALAAGLQIAQKLVKAIAEPFTLSGGPWSAKASAGLSLLTPATPDALDALRESQLALSRAKADGRGGIAIFNQDMMVGFRDQIALEEDLRGAIGSSQFQLHVQPQLAVDGHIYGGEVLLRWQHPQRGWIPPDQFIPLAESNGSIIELGQWVLREGCALLSRMQLIQPGVCLSINISPAQFRHPDFVAQVCNALASSNAPASCLILEITENLLIWNIERMVQRMKELTSIGIRFSIDDFGTGFSSLSYLRRLPLHEIKIDRSFIAELPADAAAVGIVQSILSMGSHLNLHVVAEGVETADQSEFLTRHGCDAQQGWLHGRPAPAEDWLLRLRAQATTAAAKTQSAQQAA